MCATATVPITPLSTFNEFVDPTPTVFTFIISSSSLNKVPPSILDISCNHNVVVPTPTACDNEIPIATLLVNGLCIILSMVITVLVVASSDGTEKVWVFPVPILVIVRAVPAFALDNEDATLKSFWSNTPSVTDTIAYSLSGKNVVVPAPIVAVAIPILVPPFEEYSNGSPLLKLWPFIVIVLVSTLTPIPGWTVL